MSSPLAPSSSYHPHLSHHKSPITDKQSVQHSFFRSFKVRFFLLSLCYGSVLLPLLSLLILQTNILTLKIDPVLLLSLVTGISLGMLSFGLKWLLDPYVKGQQILQRYYQSGDISDPSPNVHKVVTPLIDTLFELEKHRNALRRSSGLDFLTGLFNSHAAREILAGDISMMQDREPLNLAMLDVDYLKEINLTYGHHSGDEILKQIAKTLNKELLGSDWAARWSGQTFLVVTLSKNPTDTLKELQHSLQTILAESAATPHNTVSIGYTTLHSKDSFESLISRAKNALQTAKEKMPSGFFQLDAS